ncbi:hypothetical protein [Endozoicomonas numazuensis]|uniref:Uncharacterized protein n=1 Tax=Endozoicomonas numazuensis TaxID=1137799 RepID=A0A081NHI7_9GAMM|nr:hypothetical protein [Endozoicomonas numazuensis]KEQ17910.1 hypothetical protein GZ78_09765 [Endozoicomonas numazuensis]
MKNKVILSIAMGSMIGMGFNAAQAAETPATGGAEKVASKPDTSNGGKCASGKCGTVKIFEKANVDGDHQDLLVYARDGKCGLSGKGVGATETVDSEKQVTGLCGQ